MAPRPDPLPWRFAALAGASAGLAASPLLDTASSEDPSAWIAIGAATAAALCLARPSGARGARRLWLALLALSLLAAGIGVGLLRLAAIDGGAFDGAPGGAAAIDGTVLATPHRSSGSVRVPLETPEGRLLVEAHEPVPDLPIGSEVAARGTIRAPEPWEGSYLRRQGIARILVADAIRLTGGRRGGPMGVVDAVRDRAAAALGRGTPDAEAQLLRGFVLGQDDRIDAATVNDFRRSGLAHLLAVSGENVALLAILATPILALLGVPLRTRLVALLGLIALYVLVTGAGPSIQRAGAMGAAGVVAALAGRPRSRWYAVLLAALATLALNPRATGDPGWQLSFAAVLGIMLFAAPIRDGLLPVHGGVRPWRRALAEGAAITISATAATAPLMAAVFGAASLTSLPANLLALPAVAPVMWLGMLVAALGQIPWLPVEPLTALAGALAAYVAQVAHWMASPGWAQVAVPPLGRVTVAAAYLASALALGAALAMRRRRRGMRPRAGLVAVAAVAVALFVVVMGTGGGGGPDLTPGPGLRATVLDVGQGDAILLDPNPGAPILVDGGPPGDGIAAKLEAHGVSRLAAAVVTHDQSDHAGGIEDLLGSFPVRRLVYGVAVRRLRSEARAAGADPTPVAEGSEIDSGRLRVEFLWPPRELESTPEASGGDPNLLALVAIARWRDFEMFLTADAEAESVPIDPGPIDVLKVAHHGSDDAGLASLLDESAPRLAVISVGAGNSYGHPTPRTLATLAAHRVPVLRTDLAGDVTIDVRRDGWSATSER